VILCPDLKSSKIALTSALRNSIRQSIIILQIFASKTALKQKIALVAETLRLWPLHPCTESEFLVEDDISGERYYSDLTERSGSSWTVDSVTSAWEQRHSVKFREYIFLRW